MPGAPGIEGELALRGPGRAGVAGDDPVLRGVVQEERDADGDGERVPLRVGDGERRVDEVPVGHAAVAAAARAGVVEQEPARPAGADHPPLRHLHEVRVLRRHRRGAQLALLLRGLRGLPEEAAESRGHLRIPICSSARTRRFGVEHDPGDLGHQLGDRRGHHVLDGVGAAAAPGEQHVDRAVVVDLAERDPVAVRSEAAPRGRQRVVEPLRPRARGAGRAAPAGPPPADRPRAGAPSRRRRPRG